MTRIELHAASFHEGFQIHGKSMKKSDYLVGEDYDREANELAYLLWNELPGKTLRNAIGKILQASTTDGTTPHNNCEHIFMSAVDLLKGGNND